MDEFKLNGQEIKLNTYDGNNLAAIFLDNLWSYCRNKFPTEDYQELGSMISGIRGDPSGPEDWEEALVKATGKPVFRDTQFSLSTIFDSMIELSLYYHETGFPFPSLITLLNSMKTDPKKHELEWELWKNALYRVLQGEDIIS